MVDLQTELFEIFWLILLTWSFEVYLVLSSHIVFTPLGVGGIQISPISCSSTNISPILVPRSVTDRKRVDLSTAWKEILPRAYSARKSKNIENRTKLLEKAIFSSNFQIYFSDFHSMNMPQWWRHALLLRRIIYHFNLLSMSLFIISTFFLFH